MGLQWGHDLLIVEGMLYSGRPSPDRKLQWGHDLLIVEGESRATENVLIISLQWGHDLLIVEGLGIIGRGVRQASGFNGATIC